MSSALRSNHAAHADAREDLNALLIDRKSTRLNSSHGYISYAVFCLKKKKHSDQPRCEYLHPRNHYVPHYKYKGTSTMNRHLRSATAAYRRAGGSWHTGDSHIDPARV